MTLRRCIKCGRLMYASIYHIRDNGICYYCEPETPEDEARQKLGDFPDDDEQPEEDE